MNLLLIRPEELTAPDAASITGERVAAVQEDHKLSPGLCVRAGVLGGEMGSARVISCTPEHIDLRLELGEQAPQKHPLELIVAISRPQTMKKVLWFTGSSGIARLHLVGSAKGEKSYLQSKSLQSPHLERELFRGLEQGCDTVLPPVSQYPNVRTLLKELLGSAGRSRAGDRNQPAGLSAGVSAKAQPPALRTCRVLAALPRNHQSVPLASRLMAGYDKAVVAIGPESGWAEAEERQFCAAGFAPAALGDRVLRVEFAAAVAFGQFLAR